MSKKQREGMPYIGVKAVITQIGTIRRPKWYEFWAHHQWNILERAVMKTVTPKIILIPKPRFNKEK